MADRTLRTEESREATKRKVTWTRPNSIPDPKPQPGVEYRWIRTSTLGQADMTNVSSKFREGWEPVKAEDHPELKVLTHVDSNFKGQIYRASCALQGIRWGLKIGGGKGNNMLYLNGVESEKISSEEMISKVVQLVEEKAEELEKAK